MSVIEVFCLYIIPFFSVYYNHAPVTSREKKPDGFSGSSFAVGIGSTKFSTYFLFAVRMNRKSPFKTYK